MSISYELRWLTRRASADWFPVIFHFIWNNIGVFVAFGASEIVGKRIFTCTCAFFLYQMRACVEIVHLCLAWLPFIVSASVKRLDAPDHPCSFSLLVTVTTEECVREFQQLCRRHARFCTHGKTFKQTHLSNSLKIYILNIYIYYSDSSSNIGHHQIL